MNTRSRTGSETNPSVPARTKVHSQSHSKKLAQEGDAAINRAGGRIAVCIGTTRQEPIYDSITVWKAVQRGDQEARSGRLHAGTEERQTRKADR